MYRKKIFIALLIIVSAGLLAYSNSFKNDFVWDDEVLVTENDLIKGISINNIAAVLTSEQYPGSSTNYYRPVQTASYMLDYRIGKLNPFGYHLHNFLLHILNAILIYFLILLLTPAVRIAPAISSPRERALSVIPFLTALFWVIHPVHVEAVSYISSRADLLAAFFVLSAMIFYITASRRLYPNAILYTLCSMLFFILALFSKEMSMIFPLALIIYEGLFNKDLKGKAMRLLPFIFITLLYMFMRLTILSFSLTPWVKASFYSKSTLMRFLTLFKGIVVYLGLIFMPLNLHMERFITAVGSFLNPHVLLFIFVTAATIFILKKLQLKHKTLIIFGLLWFMVFLIPQSNFFFTIVSAEHFLYLPSLGIFIILASAFDRLYVFRKKFAIALIVSMAFFWGMLTYAQNFVWRDSFTFYRWVDKTSKWSFKVRNNLANFYVYLGKDDLAIDKYSQALGIIGDNDAIEKNIDDVTNVLIKKYRDRLRSGPLGYVSYYNIGYLYEKKGMFDEAVFYYEEALKIKPDFTEAITNLGNIYEKKGDFDMALAQYKKALILNPSFAQGYFNIGAVLGNQGNLAQAREYFKKALEIDPRYINAKESLEKVNEMLDNK